MKKQPGINGEWIPVSRQERLASAGLPTLITLGTPAAVQTLYAFSTQVGPTGWVLPLILWIYGFLFWMVSTGMQLFRSKRWEWTEEALAEQNRYMSDARLASREFWGHWWVRFPIGLLFLSVGIHALLSKDFTAQWFSFILLMSAFVTPFVFIAEMALLPLVILMLVAFMGLVTLLPVSVIVMLSIVMMVATMIIVMNRRSRLPPKKSKAKDKEEAATPAADPAAANASPPEGASEASGEAAQAPSPESEAAEPPPAGDAPQADAGAPNK